MKNTQIEVTISYDKTNEVFETNAEWQDALLTFKDSKDAHHTFMLMGDSIRFVKKGEAYLDFTFQEGLSEGIYRMDGYTITFDIKTHQLFFTDQVLDIHYVLIQDQEIISKHTIKIKRIT